MLNSDLAFVSATEINRLVVAKDVSPVEVTELYLRRIEELDHRLNSYLTVAADQAMDQARRAEAAVTSGEDLGPLHGIPISIKDLELTNGIRTTSGSLIYQDRVPDEDSVVVDRVKKTGAIILGKTNTPEFGLLGRTENRLGDPCGNPWNPQRTAGGSSGGSGAALAAGLCALATGSDGGGSIRIPASCCGVYGIKPTQGRVPYYAGAYAPISTNHFSQSGPMSRSVRDSALLLQVLAGYDPRDPGSLRNVPDNYLVAADRGIGGIRIGWNSDFGYGAIDPEVKSLTETAAKVFEELGCTVEEADIVLDPLFEVFWSLFGAVSLARNPTVLDLHSDELTVYARDAYERGASTTGADYAKALGEIDKIKVRFTDQFKIYDLILTPTMAVSPFPHGEPPTVIDGQEVSAFPGSFPHTYPINMIGHPAASVPCGFSAEGLPIGLHIIGRWGDEAMVIAASAAFEQARPWADQLPPIS